MKQGRKGVVFEYPFAVAGVNITFMIMQMLDLEAASMSWGWAILSLCIVFHRYLMHVWIGGKFDKITVLHRDSTKFTVNPNVHLYTYFVNIFPFN